MFVPLQLPDLQGDGGEVLWCDTGMLVCRINYGHMVETCGTGKFASTVKFLGGALSSSDLILNPQSIHWFTFATCAVMCGSNAVLTQKPGFPGSKRSIMMNPYMNLPLCKPQGHYNLCCDQKKGWSRETWKSHGVVKPKKIKQDPRILGKDVWRSWYFKGILTSTDWHIEIHCLNQSLLLHSGF